jgi:hypothetical protein
VLRGQGNFWDDVKGGWNKFSNWTHGSGKKWMDLGRTGADVAMPGAGGIIKGFTNLLGLGAYQPVTGNTVLASPVPIMHDLIDHGVRICNHEFIRDISSSTALSIINFGVNPGLQSTFPWLSSIASSFQKWEPNGIVFFYRATSASALNSTNTALGTIVGAVQYDVDEANPSEKTGLMNLAGAMAGPPNDDNMFPIECAPSMRLMRNLLIRRGPIDDDLQKYDLGKFLLSAVGSQAAATVGELHICYDITLKQPQQSGAQGNDLLMAQFSLTGVTNLLPLGTAATEVTDGLGVEIDSAARKVTCGPGSSGKFKFSFGWVGTSTATTAPSVSLSNCSASNVIFTTGSNYVFPVNGGTTTQLLQLVTVLVTDPTLPFSITLGAGGTLPASVTAAEIFVEQLNTQA